MVHDVDPRARRIDARGLVVMPGGVDIHAHIAGPKANAARRLSPEQHRADPVARTEVTRAGTGGTVPSTFVTGYRYALLGYTTVIEAATPPLSARHARRAARHAHDRCGLLGAPRQQPGADGADLQGAKR